MTDFLKKHNVKITVITAIVGTSILLIGPAGAVMDNFVFTQREGNGLTWYTKGIDDRVTSVEKTVAEEKQNRIQKEKDDAEYRAKSQDTQQKILNAVTRIESRLDTEDRLNHRN